MTSLIGPGMKVHMRSKMFKPPYAPHFDQYKGQEFFVIAVFDGNHASLRRCRSRDPLLVVHLDEVKRA